MTLIVILILSCQVRILFVMRNRKQLKVAPTRQVQHNGAVPTWVFNKASGKDSRHSNS